MHRNLGIQMYVAFGAKAAAVFRQSDVAGKPAVEVLTQCFGDPVIDAIAKRFTDVEILA
jgi:hypothetical protein